jgi:hypothetical protein
MPTHPIRHYGQCDTTTFGMWSKRYPVLLFLAITLMLGNAGINHYWHGTDSP